MSFARAALSWTQAPLVCGEQAAAAWAACRYLCISNLVLRLLWTYKLSPHLRHNHATVMFFTLLEAFRRFQWMFVRTEVR